MTRLVDPLGRVLRKLRVSLTDACNQRCTYCMPANPVFTPPSRLLRPGEYRDICARLVEMGIEELRLTGGEPTVRPNFRAVLAALHGLPVRRRGITSNGQLLAPHLEFLRDHGWFHLNISLDSLDPGAYERITGGDFRAVMGAIEKAKAMGFPVKVNTVVLKGINDGELGDFAAWSSASGIEVRFLELMRIGPQAASHGRNFLPAAAILDALRARTSLRRLPSPPDSTSQAYATGEGGRVGIIASETMPFCATCSRLRLSATGTLRSCLMQSGGLSLRGVGPDEFTRRVHDVLAMKPPGRPERMPEPMHAVGG